MNILTLLVLLAVPCVSLAHDKPAESGPIVIGAIFSETGIAAPHNRSLIEMVELTVDWVNGEGGVLGRKLELRLYDNKSSAIGALEAAHQAVADQVTAVIGAHWSSHSLAMAHVFEKAGIPMISPASSHPDVTQGKDYVFRITFKDPEQAEAMAWFAINKLNVRRTAILRNIDELYCSNLAQHYRLAFQKFGGTVAIDHGYRGSATDFNEIAQKLLILQPEVIYIPGYTRDTALIMKQLRQSGVSGIFLGGDGWDRLEQLIPEEVEGSYQSIQWHPDVPYKRSAVVKMMYEQTLEKKIHNLATPLAYDAVMVLVTAIRKAGTTDPSAIRESIAELDDFVGATGPVAFDQNGDPLNKDVIILRYTNHQKMFETIVQP